MKKSTGRHDITHTTKLKVFTSSAMGKDESASTNLAELEAVKGSTAASTAAAPLDQLSLLKAMVAVADVDGFYENRRLALQIVANHRGYTGTLPTPPVTESLETLLASLRYPADKFQWRNDAEAVATADGLLSVQEESKLKDACDILDIPWERSALVSYRTGTKGEVSRGLLFLIELPDKLGRLLVSCESHLRRHARASRQMRRPVRASAPPA